MSSGIASSAAVGPPPGMKVRLSSNESPFGPSPDAIAAIRAVAEQAHLYPDDQSVELRQAVAELENLAPEQVAVGTGSAALLMDLIQQTCHDGGAVASFAYSFVVYRLAARNAGVPYLEAPTGGRATVDQPGWNRDPEALLATLTPDTRVVVIDNPGNPTGTHLSGNDLRELVAGIPEHVAVVIDEAYHEFAAGGHFLDLRRRYEHVVLLRTLSKFVSLAGVRCGLIVGAPDQYAAEWNENGELEKEMRAEWEGGLLLSFSARHQERLNSAGLEDAKIQEEMRREGNPVLTTVPPGPANPLGRHWIGLTLPGVGIHGTNVPESIYRSTTHGCIRMHPEYVAALLEEVAVGESGMTIYEPILVAVTADGRIFLEVHPDIYKRIAKQLDEKRAEREQFIADAITRVKSELADAGVADAVVYGRPKHIYSIWNKMRKKGVDFSEVYDVRALRVIVDDIKDCYTALGIVHNLWVPIPKEFDDYISNPKGNNYRSLHTAVRCPDGRSLEVQIRTWEMHKHAELGVAAHWRYKEGARKSEDNYDEKIAWLLAAAADPTLETTAPYHWNGDQPPDAFVSGHLFAAGQRAYDMARWQRNRTKWATSRYARSLALLDGATPRRGGLAR